MQKNINLIEFRGTIFLFSDLMTQEKTKNDKNDSIKK